MTQQVTALCNECGKITDVVYQEQKYHNDIRETYFKCEHCYYHYTCFVTDKKVRKMHKEITRLRTLRGKNPLARGIQITKLQEQINERMSRLKYNLVNFGRADL